MTMHSLPPTSLAPERPAPPPLRPGRPEAAAVIWNWQEADPTTRGPDATDLRRHGAIRGAIGLGVGGVLLVAGATTIATIAAVLASTVLLSALLSPTGLYLRIRSLLERFGLWVGKAVTVLLMVPLFYTFFLPFRLLFRRGARDAMRRAVPTEAPTYWTPRPDRTRDYERQF